MSNQPTAHKFTLSERDFAFAVGLSYSNVRAMRRRGHIASYLKVNKRILYTPSDVEAFLRAHRRRRAS